MRLNLLITVKYEESVWMKIRSERGREALNIGCVYMPTDRTSVSVIDSYYGMSGQKGKVYLGPNVSSSANYRGCVVNGSGAMVVI